VSYSTLEVYYKTMWSLTFHYKYSIAEIEDLIPFERDLYVDMIAAYKKAEEEAAKQAQFLNG